MASRLLRRRLKSPGKRRRNHRRIRLQNCSGSVLSAYRGSVELTPTMCRAALDSLQRVQEDFFLSKGLTRLMVSQIDDVEHANCGLNIAFEFADDLTSS